MTKWANIADCGLPPFSRFPPLSVFYQQKPDKAITSEAVLVHSLVLYCTSGDMSER